MHVPKELKAKLPDPVPTQPEPVQPVMVAPSRPGQTAPLPPPVLEGEASISEIGGGVFVMGERPASTQTNAQDMRLDQPGLPTSLTGWGAGLEDDLDDEAGIEGWMPHAAQREVIIEGSGRWLDKLRSWRERCYELAVKLADGIPKGRDSLTKVDIGYGFLVTDVFNEEYMTRLHARVRDEGSDPADREQANLSLDHANALWWFLVEMSGSFADQLNTTYTCPEYIIEPLVSPNSYIRDPALLHQFHAIVHHPERLRALWMFLPVGRRQAALELIGTVPAIVELILEHIKDMDGAGIWEVATS